MAKRFTDTDKWKRPWFSDLPNEAKLVWIYLLDECDHRGVWHASFRRLNFDLNFEVEVDELMINHWFGDKLLKIDHDKYFIKSFVDFQYSTLNPNNNAHKSVIELLNRIEVDEVLMRSSQGPKDTATEKDKVKERRESGAVQQFETQFHPDYQKFKNFLEGNGVKHLRWIVPKLISHFGDYESFLVWVEIFNSNEKIQKLDAIDFKKYLTVALKSELKEAEGA